MINNELWIMLISALPLSELRGAIPIAIGLFGFSPLKAFFISVLGNIIIIIPVLFFLNKFSAYLMSYNYYINRFFMWLFERTRQKHTKSFEIWGSAALFIFTAVPFPLTGAWSACVAAFIFGIDFWKAIFSIALGVVTAGIIVLGITLGITNIF